MNETLLDSTVRDLDYRLAVAQATGRVPSMVAGVVRGGRLVWSRGRGVVDGAEPGPDTQYRVGSITKTFVAVAVMRLRDEGVVGLNDPLEAHLPGTPHGAATIAQLLSHTGGVGAELEGSWWERSPGASAEQWRRRLTPPVARPGAGHHYSNVGFSLLGAMVARLRGRDWFDVVDAEILAPLGMRRTTLLPKEPCAAGFAVHPFADVVMPETVADTAAMGPAGQLWSCVADLARWVAFASGDTADVLAPDTLAQMRAPQAIADTAAWTYAAGLGWQLHRTDNRVLCGHGGSMPGFQAGIWVDAASTTGAVSMHNATTTSASGGFGAAGLIAAVDRAEPRPPAPWTPLDSVEAGLLEVTGTWHWGTSTVTIHATRDGGLRMEAVSGMASDSRFRPNGDGTFTGLDGYHAGETLRVARDDHGTATHLSVNTFVLTRRPYQPYDTVPGGVEAGWPVE